MKSASLGAVLAAAALSTLVGCSSSSDTSTDVTPTPENVCAKIEEAGIGANCVATEGTGLNIAATDKWDFDLVSVPGEKGAVLLFDDADLYQKTVESYEEAAFLAGPHRYGSESALIFVQMNENLPADQGSTVKGIVDAL